MGENTRWFEITKWNHLSLCWQTCTHTHMHTHIKMPMSLLHAERKEEAEPMEDEGTILRKMRRLTDYYDNHKEIGRWVRERRRTHTHSRRLASPHANASALMAVWAARVGPWEGGEAHLLNNSRQKNERWVTRLSGANALARQMIRFSLTRRRRAFTVNCRAIWTAWLAGRMVCFPTSGCLLVIKQRSKLYSPNQHKQTPERHESGFSNLCTSSEFHLTADTSWRSADTIDQTVDVCFGYQSQTLFFLFSLVLNFSWKSILDENGIKMILLK